jgi:hypothetical protein
MQGEHRSFLRAYHRPYDSNSLAWVASRGRLPHHHCLLNRWACIPRSWLRVVCVSMRQARCDQARVAHLDLDVEFLQPHLVLNHGVGAN